MKVTYEPLFNQVLIQVLTESKTAGGLHLPEGSKVDKGLKVIAIGKECKYVRPGDFIVFGGNSISTLKDEDGRTTDMAVVAETDIRCIKKFKN